MGKVVFVLLTIALVTSLMVAALMACVPAQEVREELEEVGRSFLEKVAVPPGSNVYVLGPVKPGTVVQEEAPPSETAVELGVPEAPGTYYVFIVDNMPDHKLAHPMRYVWMEYESGNTTEVDASWWPVILQPAVTPAPFECVCPLTIDGISFQALGGTGAGVAYDDSHKPVALPPDIPERIPECEGRRFALVLDAGDKDTSIPGDAADNMADDADDIQGWLEANKYTVKRISQYWGNAHPRIPVGAGRARQSLQAIFAAYAANLKCCDNFFLYINAHGNRRGFAIYDATGNGNCEFVSYKDLFNWLNAFPNCVKVTIFIDACKSGGAIPVLTPLRNKLSKVTILTATDANKCAPSGQGWTDSATEDFFDGADEDNDGDKKVGDLGDRAREMVKQGGSAQNAQISKDPRHASLCDLD